jgi:hypothetical protein
MGRKKSELREILEEEGSDRYTLAERLIHHVTRAFSYVYISLVHGSFDHGWLRGTTRYTLFIRKKSSVSLKVTVPSPRVDFSASYFQKT